MKKSPAWFEVMDRVPWFDKDRAAPEDLTPLTKAEMMRAPVKEELDLHGLTTKEALVALDLFLRAAVKKGGKKFRIIHGKGLHSKTEPKLKTMVKEQLSRSPCVAHYGEEKRSDGGSGSTWVWITVPGK